MQAWILNNIKATHTAGDTVPRLQARVHQWISLNSGLSEVGQCPPGGLDFLKGALCLICIEKMFVGHNKNLVDVNFDRE